MRKRRLQVAADEIDLASIFTIHGFCTRVLREHALESGHTFDRRSCWPVTASCWRSSPPICGACTPMIRPRWSR
jgi:superfamily I DNA/RNA helicase